MGRRTHSQKTLLQKCVERKVHLDNAGDMLLVVLQHRAVCLLPHADVIEGIQASGQICQEPADQQTNLTSASFQHPYECWTSMQRCTSGVFVALNVWLCLILPASM